MSTVQQIYHGSWSSNSPMFIRPGFVRSCHYYQALQVTVGTSGTYTFVSDSSIDTYGYFYNRSVDPPNPTQNLIVSDDDGGGYRQFRMTVNPTYGSSYVLLVTTSRANIVGSFDIRVSGPSLVGLTASTPTASRPVREIGERSAQRDWLVDIDTHLYSHSFGLFQSQLILNQHTKVEIDQLRRWWSVIFNVYFGWWSYWRCFLSVPRVVGRSEQRLPDERVACPNSTQLPCHSITTSQWLLDIHPVEMRVKQ